MNVVYNQYIKAYANAIDQLKERKRKNQDLSACDNQLKERLKTLKNLITQITTIKEKQTKTQQLEQTIQKRKKIYEKRKADIETFRKVCTDKLEKIAHHTKYITAFKKEIASEFKK